MRVVAVSPDSPARLALLGRELGGAVTLLSDENEAAVTALCAGLAHCEVLLDRAGTVRWAGASESWSAVPPPSELIAAAAAF